MFVESGSVSQAPESRARGGGERGLGELAHQIAKLAAEINASTCRWLGLIAEFDRRAGHEREGFVSCSAWLAWRCSLTPRAAREQLRVARSLAELPLIREEFARGVLSYSKVRALTRVAEPKLEAELLELAQEATAAQLERLLRAYRSAITPEDEEGIREGRGLFTQWEEDGSLSLRGSLPAEEGAVFVKALELTRCGLREPGGSGSPGAEAPRPDSADALLALAETAISDGVAAAQGGDRHQVVVHVDLGTLGEGCDGAACPDASEASVADGGRLSATVARRLACDASVVSLLERDGEPLSVGRKTRTIPPAVARALRARDGGCRFPGCDRQLYVDAHHVKHWVAGGETSLENLVQLCRHHHRLVHEGGFTVEDESGELVFRLPSGVEVESAPVLPDVDAAGARPGRTPLPVIAFRPLDIDHATFVLAREWERRGASAEARAGP